MTAKRVLIVSWDGGGNFPPALALAARLVDAGHEVGVMADAAPARPSIAKGISRCGAELVEFSSLEPWPEGVTFEEDPVRFDEMRNGVPAAKDVLGAAAGFHPDVIVVDCMIGAGLVAAELLGIPTAVLVHVLYQPFVCFWGDIAVDVSRCRAALGLESLDPSKLFEQLKRAAKVLVLVPQAFDYPGALMTDETHYVGPILYPESPEALRDLGFDATDNRPLVLVSLSTTRQRQEAALPLILEAISELPVRGLVTLGDIAVGEHSIPDNVVVHDYLSHASILEDVTAVVSHGGLSTVMVSLAHGVPLVCIPQGREQPLNAERVQAWGAGLALPMDSDSKAIRDAVNTVLDEPTYRAAAGSFAASVGALGRGQAAVDHVLSLANRA